VRAQPQQISMAKLLKSKLLPFDLDVDPGAESLDGLIARFLLGLTMYGGRLLQG
jgi:hypothetical protein